MSLSFPLCEFCHHFRRGKNSCAAFPEGIPDPVYFMKHDHRFPYPGDHGITFEPGDDLPEYFDIPVCQPTSEEDWRMIDALARRVAGVRNRLHDLLAERHLDNNTFWRLCTTTAGFERLPAEYQALILEAEGIKAAS